MPSSVEEIFQATISEAIRANVSVYAIDLRGLDTSRDLAVAGGALDKADASASRRWRSAVPAARRRTKCRTAPSAPDFKSNTQRCCASWPRTPAATLTAKTNDLAKGLDRVTSDLGELLRSRLRAEERRGRRQLPHDRGQGRARASTSRRAAATSCCRRRGRAAAVLPAAAAGRRRRHAGAARLRLPGPRFRFHQITRGRQFDAGHRDAGPLAAGRGRQEGEQDHSGST